MIPENATGYGGLSLNGAMTNGLLIVA